MAIRNNGNYIFDLFNNAVEPYSDELWGSKPISDDRLEDIKSNVFNYIATNKKFRS
jgi:ABC-type dipeptide/oligopeptide/nickel transport system ATPase component